MKSFDRKWLWLAGFAVVWLALRAFWIACDSGIPAIWEYGFHTTDEGYYLCGGKEMYLWGSFVDLTRQEALNYCYSYGTHWLSYLAHLCFGLSTWSWRIPFVLLYFAGWLLMYRHVAKHSGDWFAFATCLAASSVPIVVTYERGASNDATIAALTAIAFSLASGRGRWRIFASSLFLSAIATVKPAVWVMLPVVLSSLLEERKTRSRWLDAGLFVGLTAADVYLWKLGSALTVLGVARAADLSPWQVLAQVNATYGLPTIFDLGRDFRALASFPRDPSVRTMGPTVVLISIVPAAMLLANLLRRKWSWRNLVYLMVPLYALALNVINSMYTHYFLPLLILLPAVVSSIREDFSEMAGDGVEWKRLAGAMLSVTTALVLAVLFLSTMQFDVRAAVPLYSRIHNLPQANPWLLSWPFLVIASLAGVAVVTVFRGVHAALRESWVWALMFFLAASVAFAALPAAVLASAIKLHPSDFYWPLALNLIVGNLFLLVLFIRPSALARPLFASGILAVPVVASYLLLPSWRSAAVELLTHFGHADAALATELGRILPKDAVLLGERSDQALMSLPIRAVSTFLSASNPIPYIERIRKKRPDTPFYALVDPDCPYNYRHFKEHEKEYRLQFLKEFAMPSTSTGQMGKVYLCRVVCLRPETSPSHGTKERDARRQ